MKGDLEFMDHVVKNPLKIDFHIHSEYSKYKDDYNLVKEGTKENIPILIEKLQQNNINMCAITDHDFFSYDIYSSLKAHEGEKSIMKVFPGVEFSVGFKSLDSKKLEPVHVICIFDDSDKEKVENIQKCIPFKKNAVKYDQESKCFSEETFISILKEIDLNVVTIAHQKGSVSSNGTKKRRNDVSSLGSVKFNELVACEYFESFEFKNMKNGIFNNIYAIEKNKNYDQIRFITGSDCHDWQSYPKHDCNTEDDIGFCFTYLKCLPCFRGLAMSFSDTSRISTNDNLFGKRSKYLESISMTINGTELLIPLSKGINVIIGDNSIGKSLLLHKITKYKYSRQNIKNGYEKYLKKNNIEINTTIEDDLIHTFDFQGRIRDRFNSDMQDNIDFLASKFPEDIDVSTYKTIIMKEIEKLYECIECKFLYDKKLKQLNTLVMVDEEISLKNLSAKNLQNNRLQINNNKRIYNYYTKIISDINSKNKSLIIDKDELQIIEEFLSKIIIFQEIYKKLEVLETKEYSIKDSINLAIKSFNTSMSSWRSTLEDVKSKFDSDDSVTLANNISELLVLEKKIRKNEFEMKPQDIKPDILPYGEYRFVKKCKNCDVIDKNYLDGIISRALKKGSKLDTSQISATQLKDMLLDANKNENTDVFSIFKNKIENIIDDDLESVPLIKKGDDDVYEKLSNGMNSSIYFDILSSDNKEGIYIVDQPEDDVSQTSIRKNVIKNFKNMSNDRQIIMITHNPQFVVNLDVDNVICITRSDEGINIQSGALEYENSNEEIDILKMVARNLDGGVESIRKRWKRYDKAISFDEER